jgi:hypothetical protein
MTEAGDRVLNRYVPQGSKTTRNAPTLARKQIKRFMDALADQANPEALVPFAEYAKRPAVALASQRSKR